MQSRVAASTTMLMTPLRDAPVSVSAWRIPERYNIGVDVCDRWAALDPGRPAIVDAAANGAVTTFGALRERSNRLAGALRRLGIGAGDRAAVFLPQCSDVIVAHVAAYKLGAIALPLAAVFGADALHHRLADAGARVVVTDDRGAAKIAGIAAGFPALETVISIDGPAGAALGAAELMERADPAFDPVPTRADDPALMIYTSGTTGQPKGALHAHRVLLGHLPGLRWSHDGFPRADDLMWTPADWAWAGGLLNAALPALHFGVPIVARRSERFDPEAVAALLRDTPIRNAFLPPTALRLLRASWPAAGPGGLGLRTLSSAGEALGAETRAWTERVFGVPLNDVYGQTECNYVLGSSVRAGIDRPGAIGRAIPGHDVAVVRPDGTPCTPGEPGEIAVGRPDAAMFLRYWNAPEATADKFIGRWMTTGDRATVDADGYVSFLGRTDDVITSSGFRIGPGEIEDCLMRHPAVAAAAAVGKPDPIRTEIVKAFVVLRAGQVASDALEADIKAFVRRRLSAHEYPRDLTFVPALPMTTTGKIMRRVLRERG